MNFSEQKLAEQAEQLANLKNKFDQLSDKYEADKQSLGVTEEDVALVSKLEAKMKNAAESRQGSASGVKG